MNDTRAKRITTVLVAVLTVTSAFAGTVALSGTAAAAPGDVLYRANAGGTVAASSGPDWADDAQYLVAGGGDTSDHAAPDAIDDSVPSGTPAGIWTTERWDPDDATEMQYEFDVAAGTKVEVRLYFYDGYGQTSDPGDRVFDVSVEGQTAENFDPIAAYGDQTGGMESFTVTSDGTIDVDFGHVEENPQLNAIEIVAAEPSPGELSAPESVDFGTVVSGGTGTQTVTLTNAGEAGDGAITVSDVTVTGADAGEFSADFSGSATLAPGETTAVDVTFAPSDATPKAATLEVTHDAPNTTSPLTVPLSGEGSSDVPVGFGVSGLDVSIGNPTSLDFGPDGRLYVSQQSGAITAFEITRNGPNDYEVTDTETIGAIQDIPNHDDDGSYNPNVGNRQVTGLIVEGTADTPVVYVTSSDPRIGAGGGHTDSGLDTNSGVVSRLTQQSDGGWDHDMLVRGLPRSEENHATNGLQYDAASNTLYLAQGGHTNKGAPSDNFALTPEYALSAAVLSVDLDQIDAMSEKDAANTDATYLYDLPTLDPDATPTDGPFGGMDGENMATWTADSPVDVYSPGFRNAYDIALDEDGQLYATDNSANPGWGGIVVNEGPQGQCTNAQNEQDEFSAPGVYHIAGEDYYGGHPNPTRGNATSQFAAAVESGLHDPVNCDYIAPTNATSESAALETFDATAQGMDVYTASNFGGAMQGDLLLAMWNSGDVQRVELNAQGTEATNSEALFENIGSNPLDVHAQGDDAVFPGTVWAATYGSNQITVFEPNDYDGAASGVCTADDPNAPDYDPDGDADGDGYTNADENEVGTDPCSQASQPEDWDGDGSPDSIDPDDDGDGLLDTEDPFAVDAQNGLDNDLPVDRQFEAGQHPQSLFGLGFTGLMTNGTDYADLYDGSKVRAGGATERISVDEVPYGDAYENKNSQAYAFQYGVNATGDAPFTVTATVESPFSDDMTPENWQAAGMYLGTGDQDNYVKLVASAQDASGQPNGGVQFLKESGGTVANGDSAVVSEPAVFGSGQTIDLFVDVYPSNDTAVASYSIDDGERVYLDQTLTVPEDWYADSEQGMAVGLISTANGADETFSASWDRLTVTEIGANAPPVADAGADQTVTEGQSVTLDATGSTDADGDQLGYSWTQTAGPDAQLSVQDGSQPTFTAPDVDGDASLTFEVTVTDTEGASDTDSVTVTVEDDDEPTATETVFAVNAGGPAYTAADGTEYQADANFVGGQTFTMGSAGTPPSPEINGTDDDALYHTERYGESFGYEVPVENGTYAVTLQFAEIYQGVSSNDQPDSTGPTDGTNENDRLFDASVEGEQVLSSYDIYADVGPLTASEQTYTVEVTDGTLNVDFSAVNDNAKVSAITVDKLSAGGDGPTTGEATVSVDAGEGIGATTYDSGSFVVTNTGEEDIESLSLNLSSAVLPDVVFDPDGTAGDQGAKGFTLDDDGTSGTVEATVSDPENGVDGADGYSTLTVDFGSFQPGESVAFSIDNDPTSIKGGSSVQSGEAGPISGLELAGGRVTVQFADGATAETSLFGDGSDGGSQAVADATTAPAPSLGVENVTLNATTLSDDHTAATVADASQTVTVSGEPGATVTLLRVEGELNLVGVPDSDGTPGYGVEPFEANNALDVEEYTVTVGSDGTATVPVELTNSSAAGGLNYLIAAADDGEGETGLTSNVVVLRYDESADAPDDGGDDPTGDALYRVNVGGPAVAVAGGTDWAADTESSPSQYLAAGGAVPNSQYPAASVDSSVPDGTPTEIFATERYDPADGPEMSWSFPVQAGTTYEVRLHFHDGYPQTDAVGERVFDVSVEGEEVLTEFDVIETYGDNTAGTQTFTVTPTDGELNVSFGHVTENPQLNGVEVVEVDSNDPPTLDALSDQTVTEGDLLTVPLNASDADGDDLSLSVDAGDASGFVSLTDDGDGTGSLTVAPATGAADGGPYTVTVTADDGDASVSQTFVLTVEAGETPPGPVGNFTDAPTDPDGDGVYEDVNGDGTFNVGDVQAFYVNYEGDTVQNDPQAFDFNGDGSVNVGDVQALYAAVNAGGD